MKTLRTGIRRRKGEVSESIVAPLVADGCDRVDTSVVKIVDDGRLLFLSWLKSPGALANGHDSRMWSFSNAVATNCSICAMPAATASNQLNSFRLWSSLTAAVTPYEFCIVVTLADWFTGYIWNGIKYITAARVTMSLDGAPLIFCLWFDRMSVSLTG